MSETSRKLSELAASAAQKLPLRQGVPLGFCESTTSVNPTDTARCDLALGHEGLHEKTLSPGVRIRWGHDLACASSWYRSRPNHERAPAPWLISACM